MLQKLTYSLHGVMLTDTQLKELGLTASGHRMKLRDYCAKRKNVGSDENERKEKLKKLQALIGGSSRLKSKRQTVKDMVTTKRQQLRFEFGWKHWSDRRFKQKKVNHGGQSRVLDVPRFATLEDCLEIVKSLFFPSGESPAGNAKDMSFALGNYAGDIIADLKENGELCSLSAERYKRVTRLNHLRLYLLSKCLHDSDDAISEYLQSKCASCNEYTDRLLLKTVPFPDLVVIEEESSELVQSNDLCVICTESESTRHKLLVTRCCHQFAHIFCHRRYYCIADVCLTQDYADEVTAKLYSENCFVCCSCPEKEAPLDHFIVQHLILEINPDANDRRIQDANATLSSLCAGLTSKI